MRHRAGQRSQADLYAAYEDNVDRMSGTSRARRVCNEVNDIFAGHLNHYAHAWFCVSAPAGPAATNPSSRAGAADADRQSQGFRRQPTDDAGCEAQCHHELQRFRPANSKSASAFSFLRDTVCGLAHQHLPSVDGEPSPSTTTA